MLLALLLLTPEMAEADGDTISTAVFWIVFCIVAVLGACFNIIVLPSTHTHARARNTTLN